MAPAKPTPPNARDAAESIPLDDLLTGAPHAVWSFDARARNFASLNPDAGKRLGVPRDDFESWRRAIHPEDRDRACQALDALASGDGPERADWDYRINAKAGEVHWVRDSARRVNIQGSARVLGITLDISREKSAELGLVESERARRHLLSVLPGMAYRCRKDANWTIEYVSDGCFDLTGYTAAELTMNPNLSLGHLIHPDDVDGVAAKCDEALARRTHFRGEYRLRARDGTVKWVWDQCLGVYDAAGNVLTIEGFIADITEHKKLEADLFQSQKMESIGRLAGGIAHDFNNLLTAILGYSELARSSTADELATRQYLDYVTQAAQRANGLTQQLLAFARRQIVEPATIRVDEMLIRLSPLLRRLVTENIEFVVLAPGKAGSILADRNQIEQVLINLVANARDAMPHGGKLTIEADQVTLDTSEALPPGVYVRIQVRDTGAGIRPETKPFVFEPFFTTKMMGKGAGLGLATCFGIVKQHQGHIDFRSQEGEGTTFEVLLPLVEDGQGSPVKEVEPSVSGGRETILVVEDEALVRNMAVEALRARGYSVLTANNGAEAMKLVKQHFGPLDMLITDLVMPQLGGSELAELLEKSRPGLRVLYTSGYTESFEVPKSLRAIGGTFLRKPYTPAILAAKVREVLD